MHVAGKALCIELARDLVDVGPDAAQLSHDRLSLLVGDERRRRRPLEVTALQELRDCRPAQRCFARDALVFIRREADV